MLEYIKINSTTFFAMSNDDNKENTNISRCDKEGFYMTKPAIVKRRKRKGTHLEIKVKL